MVAREVRSQNRRTLVVRDCLVGGSYVVLKQAFGADGQAIDLREANKPAAQKLVALEDHWARLKWQANPVGFKEMTFDAVAQLADSICFCALYADDHRRDFPDAAGKVSR